MNKSYPIIAKSSFVKRKPSVPCPIQEMSFTVEVQEKVRIDVRFNKSIATGYQVHVQCYSNNKLPVLEYFHNSNKIPTAKEIKVFVEKFVNDWRVQPRLNGVGHVSYFLPNTG